MAPKTKANSSLWIEKYRSPNLKGVLLPLPLLNKFKKDVEAKQIPNYLFHSRSPGTGKSTVAKALLNDCDYDYIYINGSVDNGIDLLRDKIMPYAANKTIDGNKKAIIFDEFDRASTALQDGLKAMMETYSEHIRFIYITNHIHKIDPYLQSRCSVKEFSFNEKEVKEKQFERLVKRVIGILKAEKVPFEESVVRTYVDMKYPDLRKVIGDMQDFYDMFGTINEQIFKTSDIDEQLFNMLLSKQVTKAREIIIKNNYDLISIYGILFKKFVPLVGNGVKGDITVTIAKYQTMSINDYDKELTLAACFYEIASLISEFESQRK